MRKLLLLAAVLLTATACVEQKGDGLYMYSQEVDSPSSAWTLDGDHYVTYSEVPQITKTVCDIGTVNVYMYIDNKTQVALPYTRHYTEKVDGEWVDYTQTIDFEYTHSPGGIYFFITNSDFVYTSPMPEGNYYFRVVMTW
ncbi:hypothetical protein LJC45_02795 [Alistipes sp. OttesenSCG-928-B03]|nr:hypothetical protein [Alistipes sp. OttesenSCG-928-B03]